jgi:hypothetical protein
LTGAGAVVALVLIEWTAGWVAGAAWTQSWGVVTRGHFRITGYIVAVFSVLALLANRHAVADVRDAGLQPSLVTAMAVLVFLYLALQWSRSDVPAAVVGALAGAAGVGALIASAPLLRGWPDAMAAVGLITGALLLGGVWNGMMLGHWYLNQPGLKTWALARLTNVALAATGASAAAGLISVSELSNASTQGAVLGLPGFGDSFSVVFFVVWVTLVLFTGAVVWGVRRCVKIKSIQSATGLFYVAVLTAGVSEFLVRYLMVNAT